MLLAKGYRFFPYQSLFFLRVKKFLKYGGEQGGSSPLPRLSSWISYLYPARIHVWWVIAFDRADECKDLTYSIPTLSSHFIPSSFFTFCKKLKLTPIDIIYAQNLLTIHQNDIFFCTLISRISLVFWKSLLPKASKTKCVAEKFGINKMRFHSISQKITLIIFSLTLCFNLNKKSMMRSCLIVSSCSSHLLHYRSFKVTPTC